MAPKNKFTQEEIIDTALQLTREKGLDAVTAREIAKLLGTSTRPIFSYYSSMDDLKNDVLSKAQRLFSDTCEEGLKMTPPFKGYGMAILRFAAEEPALFRVLFMTKQTGADFMSVLGTIGRRDEVHSAIKDTFNLEDADAEWLWKNLMIYAHGIASLMATDIMKFSEEDFSCMLSNVTQRLIVGAKISKQEKDFNEILFK